MMRQIIVDIVITSDAYLRYYQGSAQDIAAVSRDGRNVRFPANILKPFITHEGIKGAFSIEYDDNNKFKLIRKIS
jgi:hypothetical protein